PAFLEDADEKEQLHRIRAYLHNLRDRLRDGIMQQQVMVQSSVQLLKDISDVTKTMQVARNGSNAQTARIRRLILGFETVSAASSPQNPTVAGISLMPEDISEIQALLAEFELLNKGQLLRESLLSFKSSRESLEKVLAFLDQNVGQYPQRASPQPSQLMASPSASRSLREKIEAFNKGLEEDSHKLGGDNCRHFINCFSSRSSLQESPAAAPIENKVPITPSRTNSGYEGDIDSEVDQ
ncbi:hypothetical protein KR009_002036, partial [Drosophila setifemur]